MIKMSRSGKPLVFSLAFVGLLLAVRIYLQPRPSPPHVVRVDPDDRELVRASLSASVVDRPGLIRSLASKRVILVGESHFIEEPQAWLRDLLRDLHGGDGRRAVLALELPRGGQSRLDRFMASGKESDLESAFGWGALPYHSTVRWARTHPEAVAQVIACDEEPWRTGLMRLFLTDTRNDTMARAVADAARRNPGLRIVVYGGSLHMMKAGRYLYDSDTRRPIGQRLPSLGIPPHETAAVWLFAGPDPVDGVWEAKGSLDLGGPAGDLPLSRIEETRIHGVEKFREVVDFAVHLGPATRIRGH